MRAVLGRLDSFIPKISTVLASHTYSGLRTWVASTPQLQNLHLFSRTVHNLHSHSNASKVTIAANLGWRKCNSSSHSIVSTWRPLAQGPASRNFMNTRLAITMKDSLRDHLLSATQSTRVGARISDHRLPSGARGYYNSYNRSSWSRWTNGGGDGTDVTYALIAANVAVFFGWQVANRFFMVQHFTTSIEHVKNLQLHTLVTSAFSQYDTGHLAFNMIALYSMGRGIGETLGGKYLLQLYLTAAVTSALSQMAYGEFKRRKQQSMWFDNPRNFILGASGAVSATTMLWVLLFPNRQILLYMFIPVPAAVFGAGIMALDFYHAYSAYPGRDNIAHVAHIGGALTGVAAWISLRRHGRRFF